MIKSSLLGSVIRAKTSFLTSKKSGTSCPNIYREFILESTLDVERQCRLDNKDGSLNIFSLNTSKLAVNAWQRERWHTVGEDGSVAALEQHAHCPAFPTDAQIGGRWGGER